MSSESKDSRGDKCGNKSREMHAKTPLTAIRILSDDGDREWVLIYFCHRRQLSLRKFCAAIRLSIDSASYSFARLESVKKSRKSQSFRQDRCKDY